MARKKSFDVTDDLRFQNTRVQPVTEEAAEDGAQTPGYTMLNAKDITPSPFNEGLDMDSIDSYVRSMKETVGSMRSCPATRDMRLGATGLETGRSVPLSCHMKKTRSKGLLPTPRLTS